MTEERDQAASMPGPRGDETAVAAGSLPAASAVSRASVVSRASAGLRGWARWRKVLAIGSFVAGTGLVVIGLLTSGGGQVSVTAGDPVTAYAPVKTPGGSKVPVGESLTVEREVPDDALRDSQPIDGSEPGESSDATPEKSDPGPVTPGSDSPGPGAPAPGPVIPGATPAPATPPPAAPEPTAPPAPVAAQPLAFAGLVKNGLLGLPVISSYTLSLTGQPGATASVSYGGNPAGSVTFDPAGRASIQFGRALIDLGLGDPLIVVAYSDGTAGAAIEARRDSLLVN